MTQVCLIVDAESVRVRSERPVTANMWLLFDAAEFPMPGWNDFAVVILGWWVAALLRLMHGETESETVNFMDGPYAVEVGNLRNGKLFFRALKGPGRQIESAAGEALVGAFVNGLLSQSRAVLRACRDQGVWSSDEETLHSALELLEAHVRLTLS